MLPIAERHVPAAEAICRQLFERGVRVEVDDRSETLGFKIRDAETHKVPLMLVVGDQEEQNGTVTPRLRRGGGRELGAMSPGVLVEKLERANVERRTDPLS